jgi:hypothetical protein
VEAPACSLLGARLRGPPTRFRRPSSASLNEMGFSRYLWQVDGRIDDATWRALAAAARRILTCCAPLVHGVRVDDEMIAFQSDEGIKFGYLRDHREEDGVYDARGRRYRGNCKTNGRPIDLAIGAIDLLMKAHLRDRVCVRTDGGFMMCSAALSMIHDLIGPGIVELAALAEDLEEPWTAKDRDEGALPWTRNVFAQQGVDGVDPLFRYELNRQLVLETYLSMNIYFPRQVELGSLGKIEVSHSGRASASARLLVGPDARSHECTVTWACRCGCGGAISPLSPCIAPHVPRFNLVIWAAGSTALENLARMEMPGRNTELPPTPSETMTSSEQSDTEIPF